jgi:hypothetical protein
MGDFWTKHHLNNGKPMSPRQIQRVEQLEAEIAYYEHRIDECSEAIDCIKRGGKKKIVNFEIAPF